MIARSFTRSGATSIDSNKDRRRDARLTMKIDALLLAEICRLDAGIDGVDRELRSAIDIRERLSGSSGQLN
jgi:hypothetical protein